MKLYHSGKNTEVSDISQLRDITDALYEIGPEEIKDYYKIHVNFVGNNYIIDLEPTSNRIPVIKLSSYISKSGDREIIRINPKGINFPDSTSFTNYNSFIEIVNEYEDIFDFITALYDFEYEL